MESLRLCSVSDEYIAYLCSIDKKVYSNKEDDRTHTRKYLGVALNINEFTYYIPLSSPKNTDYEFKDGKKSVRKSIVPIVRIIYGSGERKKLMGTLRISNMIPVPESELIPYEVEKETDKRYKDVIFKEMIYIRRNEETIRKYASMIYDKKQRGDTAPNYMNSVLSFSELEQACKEYKK